MVSGVEQVAPYLDWRDCIKRMVTMDGLTEAEQEELYDLFLRLTDESRARGDELIREYRQRGATFRYDK
jgi:hypothetical protein